jgi:hypothetical protein
LRQWRRAAGLVNRALTRSRAKGQNPAWTRADKLRCHPMPPADVALIPYLIDLLMW